MLVFYLDLNTTQANLASDAAGRRVLYFGGVSTAMADFLVNLNTNQASLASEASGQKVVICSLNLTTNYVNLASVASVRKGLVFH